MAYKKNILFIVNPNSGTYQIKDLTTLIENNLDLAIFNFELTFTKAPKHATELSNLAATNNYYAVAIVGGDGSVNETAKGILNSETHLAILPKGSGNGLARHLNIPLKIADAIKTINNCKPQNLDCVQINNNHSFNVAGCGFDGHISHLFAKTKKRGLFAYIKLSVLEYFKYKAQNYTLTVNGKNHTFKAFTISIANSSQFGNNILIAPTAKTNDGIINLTVVKPFNKLNFAPFLYYLLTKQLHKAPFVQTFECTAFTIKSESTITSHIDGEAVELGNDINGTIIANAIKVLT